MADLPPPTERTRITTASADTWQQELVITESSLDFPRGIVTAVSSRIAMPSVEDEQAFRELTAQWRAETAHFSLTADQVNNFAYHQIMAMGRRALPLIFSELAETTSDWFWALRAIARDRAPAIPGNAQGDVDKVAAIWLQWGKDNGYVAG